MVDKSLNSGVGAQTGFAVQRNSALYLLLDNYEKKFKEKNYFICLEHHDDFLFCFLNDKNEADSIEAYQSKKKDTNAWTLGKKLYEIITNLLKTGISISEDGIEKSGIYKQFLYFSTNQTIELKVKEGRNIIASEVIKNDNVSARFIDLDTLIKNKISSSIHNKNLESQLDNLNFIWLDLARTVKEQENQLVGKISEVFNSKLPFPESALKIIIKLFSEVECTYNQKNKAEMLDNRKRVTSQEIDNTFILLTSKAKCFDYWRDQKNIVCDVLNINILEKERFQFAFLTAFDFFKSDVETAHQAILDFVEQNIENCISTKEETAVANLVTMYNKTEYTTLGEVELKAIMFAALFEVILKHK